MIKRVIYCLLTGFLLAGCSLDTLFADFNKPPLDNTLRTVQPAVTSSPNVSPNPNCYDPILLPDRGIQVGSQAIVQSPGAGAFSDLNVSAEFYFDRDSSSPDAILSAGEVVTILNGPFCYYTRNGQTRWWHVRVNSSGLEGYMDEYSTLFKILQIYLSPQTTTISSLKIIHFAVSIPSALVALPTSAKRSIFRGM